jgi:glycosyltransferase involved in cell wall biosynthesis
MPEISEPLVLGNAGLIDTSLSELPLKSDGADPVLGHLSDLSVEKGIGAVVDLAVALYKSGKRVRLIVGGPAIEGESQRHLDRATQELGDLFEYRGILTGDSKHAFFQDITHFIFPSRYAHEAVPLVLYEAMAAGAVCVATRQGSIPDQLEGSPCLLTNGAESFVEEALPFIADTSVSTAVSQGCRRAYLGALSEAEQQLAELIDLLAGRPGIGGPDLTG